MSMRSWSEQGYGFPLFNGENLENVKQFFIKRNPHMAEKFTACTDEFDLDEVVDMPVSHAIAEVLNKETGLNCFVGYDRCGDTDVDDHLGIAPIYIWAANQKTKELTQESADMLLKQYAEELGITEKPEYFKLEYFG